MAFLPSARVPRPRIAFRGLAIRHAAALGLACLLVQAASCSRGPTYELPYGPNPFLPAEARLDGVERLAPGALAGSAMCGRPECHPGIYRDWQASLHRPAATDPNYRFALERSVAEDYGVAATRLCVGCHEPGLLLAGGVDRQAKPDPATRREGVSCLSCHLVTATHESTQHGVVANAAYTVSMLPRDLLFPDPAGGSEALSRHAAALRRPFLSENRFCDSCHRFFLPTQLVGSPPGRLRLQSTEAEGSKFGDPMAEGYQSCVDCHMPRIPGEDPASKAGLIHDHRALGSNVLVPMLAGDTRHVAQTEAFRRAGAVDMEIGDFARDKAGGLIVPVVLRNQRNGHDFPTGATDISEYWLELTVTDGRGAVVYRSPGLGPDRYLSPDAPSLNTLMALQGGDLDFLHDLVSQVEVRRHPRIRPGGMRELGIPVVLPADAVAPLQAVVVLRGRHGNERWNRWAFNFADVEVPVSDLVEGRRTLGEPPPPPQDPTPFVPPVEVPEGMALIPGGTYLIGSDPQADPDADSEETPRHPVTLAPFFLDRVPATNADWLAAMKAGRVDVKSPPWMLEPPYDRHSWHQGKPPAGLETHPVVLLTFPDAEAYCASMGKRLPTEAEWEAAARGFEGRLFAWGDTFDPSKCNTLEAGYRASVPAGSMPGNATPEGVLDLGCNVSEWVATPFHAYPRFRQLENREDWVDHFNVNFRVMRGGTYETSWRRARGAARGFDERMVHKLIGVRCAMDVPGGVP